MRGATSRSVPTGRRHERYSRTHNKDTKERRERYRDSMGTRATLAGVKKGLWSRESVDRNLKQRSFCFRAAPEVWAPFGRRSQVTLQSCISRSSAGQMRRPLKAPAPASVESQVRCAQVSSDPDQGRQGIRKRAIAAVLSKGQQEKRIAGGAGSPEN